MLNQWMRETLVGARQLVLPDMCAGCGAPNTLWCSRCAHSCAQGPTQVITPCSLPMPVWGMGDYDGPLGRAIIAYKEHGVKHLRRPLGDLYLQALARLVEEGDIHDVVDCPWILVPAPSHPRSLRTRGFDHVRLLAQHVAQYRSQSAPAARYSSVVSSLVSSAPRRDAVGLTAQERSAELARALTFQPHLWASLCHTLPSSPPPEILLLDDIVTTGATLLHCATALENHGIRVRGALTLASVTLG